MTYPAPSYTTGLVTEVSNEILSEIQKNYGENTTAFKFNTMFGKLVQTWLEEFEGYGGTILAIDTTGNQTILFDQFKHGYNAVMELNEQEDLSLTKSIDLPAPIEIIIAFQYGGDEAEYLEEGKSKYVQDYFGWVVIYKQNDNGLEEIFSYECA